MNREKQKNFLITFAYVAVIFLMVFAVLRYLMPLLAPFVTAVFIAWILRRPILFLTRRLNLPHKLAAILAVLLFYSLAGLILSLLGIRLVAGVSGLIANAPILYADYVQPFFLTVLQNVEILLDRFNISLAGVWDDVGSQLLQSLGQMVSQLSVAAMSYASGVASSLPGTFIKLVLMIIATFFIAIDYDTLKGFFKRQMSEKRTEVVREIKEYLRGTLWVCIRSYFVIMSITFVELAIGLSLLKIRYAVLVAFLIAVFDILPVLGTGGIMIPWAVLTAVQGEFRLALSLLAIYLIITVIRNIIEPKIVGGQLGLHPVVTLASMFAGVQLFGVIGLFGFPIGLSLMMYLNKHGIINWFK